MKFMENSKNHIRVKCVSYFGANNISNHIIKKKILNHQTKFKRIIQKRKSILSLKLREDLGHYLRGGSQGTQRTLYASDTLAHRRT